MSEWLDCIKTDDYMQVRAALCQSQTSCFSCPIKSLCSSRTVARLRGAAAFAGLGR